MRKVISMFLASSIKDLREDRLSIGDFINQLNTIFYSQNVFINLYKCEDESMDHSICIGGSQKSLNECIAESDLCLVVFWHKVGDITKQELQIALKAFELQNRPKIVVYFKRLENGETMSEEIRQMRDLVDIELLHYHREYSHIDSLKLGIITQLQVHGFLRVDMDVEQEHVSISGRRVASTRNIPVYSQNREYLDLFRRCRIAEENCVYLRMQYDKNRDSQLLRRKYQIAVTEQERLQADLAELANLILKTGVAISRRIVSGVATERIREAIRLFDIGDFDGVLDCLPPDVIDCYFLEADIMEEQANMARQNGINEYFMRISALEMQGKWKEVQETYERVLPQVEGHPAVSKTMMLEYARFLYRQKQYQKGVEICERLRASLMQNPRVLSEQETADLLDLQGELYYLTMRYTDAERTLKEAIRQREASEMLEAERDILIAGSCVNLAKVYYMVNRHFDAEKQYLNALARYKAHDTEAIEPVDVDIARTSLELGDLYYMINRHEEAEKLFRSAYEKYSELVEHGEKQYTSALAKSCNKISYLLIAIPSHKKAELYYVEALKVKHLLTRVGVDAYFLFLERICSKLGSTWSMNSNMDFGSQIQKEAERIRSEIHSGAYADSESEDYLMLNYSYYERPMDKPFVEYICGEALRLYTLLADENPDAYESSLAEAYNNMGIFYAQTDDGNKAEKCYSEAVRLRERLVQIEPSMKTALAQTYSNLAQYYSIQNRFEESEKFSRMAIEIYNEICNRNAGAFDNDLARNYHYLANMYAKFGSRSQAEECYFNAVMLYIRLYEKSPRAYVDRIIHTINNVITFLVPLDAKSWMEEFVSETQLSAWLQREPSDK